MVNSAAARPRPRPHRTPRALHPLWVDTISSVLSIIHSTATTYLSCIYISMRTICGWWRVSTIQLLHLCSSHAHNANVRNLNMYQWVFSYSEMVAGMDAMQCYANKSTWPSAKYHCWGQVHMLNVVGGRGRGGDWGQGVPGSLTDTLLGCRLQWPRCRCLWGSGLYLHCYQDTWHTVYNCHGGRIISTPSIVRAG